MATTFTKVVLSGSTNGRQVNVTATATPGTLVHTASATALDEIWLWVTNTDTTARKITIEYGGVSSPTDISEVTVPAESGLMLVIPGLLLTNSLVVRVFAATTGVINFVGYVNRIA